MNSLSGRPRPRRFVIRLRDGTPAADPVPLRVAGLEPAAATAAGASRPVREAPSPRLANQTPANAMRQVAEPASPSAPSAPAQAQGRVSAHATPEPRSPLGAGGLLQGAPVAAAAPALAGETATESAPRAQPAPRHPSAFLGPTETTSPFHVRTHQDDPGKTDAAERAGGASGAAKTTASAAPGAGMPSPDLSEPSPRGTAPTDPEASRAGDSTRSGMSRPGEPLVARATPAAGSANAGAMANAPSRNAAQEGGESRTSALPEASTAKTPRAGAAAESATNQSTPNESVTDAQRARSDEAEREAIRAENIPGRHLRIALRVAHKHGIRTTDPIEAVRLLRQKGIDPFTLEDLLELAAKIETPLATGDADAAEKVPARSTALAPTKPPSPPANTEKNDLPALAAVLPSAEARAAEIRRIQEEIARRRRRRFFFLLMRLAAFVFLPTALVGYYFFFIATPLYATQTELVIQQADVATGARPLSGLGAMLAGTSLASQQDSVTVQAFLQSREAMRRLDAEHGFKAYWQHADIDPLRRLSPDATDEDTYRLYSRVVQVAYDPTEGLIRMEVVAADPQTSERFARALVAYAEEQVDALTARVRETQMRDALAAVAEAEARAREAQLRVLELQERYRVLSSEVEVSLISQQIAALEAQLSQERLALEDLRANPRPNPARLQQSERRVAALEAQIDALRASLTQSEDGASLARIQRELAMAEAEVATRQILLQQAMAQLEAARLEANRQVRFLSMAVPPVAADEPAYPRKIENTLLAFLICSALYLLTTMTVAILREQVTA